MNIINFISDCYANELKIALDENIKRQTWQEVKNLSTEINRHCGYINLLSRKYFIQWLNLVCNINITDTNNIIDYITIWEFINGNAINVNNNRLVLIPTETQDRVSISIPQEWLKIPEWVGSYYVVVGVNLEENYLDFWGYINYDNLQENGETDNLNHTVNLPYECLETDLNLMALEYEYSWENIPQVSPLKCLSPQIQKNLITELENSFFPRLSLDFSDWLSLVSIADARYKLYSHRHSISLGDLLKNKTENILRKGWQSLQDFIKDNFETDFDLKMSPAFRSISPQEGLNVLVKNDNYGQILEILNTIPNWQIRENLQQEFIRVLVDLINNTNDEEILWSSVFALESLQANHSLCSKGYGKLINFDEENKNYCLLINILPRNFGQISIFVRVSVLSNEDNLPESLSLKILDENEDLFQAIISEKGDNTIQYKFWADEGETFKIQVSCNNNYIEDTFKV
ncbi:DUF1822 family protein [Cyanobacterium aponinum UTEX 3222]|uniref:DUF1822 family protein n=1 Tax=Cyanobacterium aponinum TaxID=379064 RepID=UPI00308559FB|nr:DUF1822 family protein [Cyanobacterium aponinum UTEX 3222]